MILTRLSDCRPAERRSDEPYLVINEIAMNFGMHSYVEIYGRDMPQEVFRNYYYGLVVMQPSWDKKKIKIKSIIDLVELQNPPVGKYFLVVGNPKPEDLRGSGRNYFSTNWLSPKPQQVKLFGNTADWLSNANNELTMIVLTISKDESIFQKLDGIGSRGQGRYPFLEDEKELKKYIEESKMDTVIVTGMTGKRTKCNVLTKLMDAVNLVKGKLKPFLPDPSGIKKSLSKCANQLGFLTYSHQSFKAGSLTPGRANDCNAQKFILQDILHKVTSLQPSSTSLSGTFETPEDYDFSRISGNQMNVDKVKQAMAEASSRADRSICPPGDEIDHGISPLRNELNERKAKRIKLMEEAAETEECSPFDDPDVVNNPELALPFERERKRTLTIDVEYIFQHIQDKFADSTLADIPLTYTWFQLVYDHDDPRQTRFNCYFCSRYADEFRIKTKDNLAKKQGVMFSKERNRELIRNHDKSSTHIGIKQKFDIKYNKELQDSIYSDILRDELFGFHVTNNHIRTIFNIVKREYSFRGFGSFIGMQKMHSAKIGDFCRSQRTAVNMIRSISAVYRQEFKASLLKSNNYLTMIVDGSSGT